VHSELLYLLVSLDKRFTAEAPGEPWETYYARQIYLPCSEALADHLGSGPGEPSLNGSFVGAATVRSSSEQPCPAMTEPTSAA
jgi:hypothetical protein